MYYSQLSDEGASFESEKKRRVLIGHWSGGLRGEDAYTRTRLHGRWMHTYTTPTERGRNHGV